MEITKPDFGAHVPIDAYGDGGFRLAGVFHKGSQLLLPDGPEPWLHADVPSMGSSDLEKLAPLAQEIDFLLVGCGPEIVRLPTEARAYLDDLGIPVELMNTGAACRTFNVLIAEARPLAALLIAVD
jgi:uncharacterized protein